MPTRKKKSSTGDSRVYHEKARQMFLRWFQSHFKGWRAFLNFSGQVMLPGTKTYIRVGIPNTKGGGGPDYIAFGPNGKTAFYEIKTDRHSKQNKKQKHFMEIMSDMGFDCFVFVAHDDETFDVIPFGNY